MTTALPKILICGDLYWTKEDIPKLFDGIAQVIMDDASNRADFLARFRPNGPYNGTIGLYRMYTSTPQIGMYDRELIMGLPPSIRWIAQNAAGYDAIDVHACKERGIGVSNTPGEVDESTATTALYLILSTIRHFSKAERSLYEGTWKNTVRSSETHDLSTRTVGILGMGGIGLTLAHLIHAFPGPPRVLYHNRRPRADVPEWCEYVDSVQALCEKSDILSVHAPLNGSTEGMVGEQEIRAMKRGGVIVNTARGKVVDQEAMIRALRDGHLASVGLDVYPNEPNIDSRLLEFPQVALLPHVGTHTQDTERKMELRALWNLRDFLLAGSGKDLVPELR